MSATNPWDGGLISAEQLPIVDRFVGNLSIRYAVDGEMAMINVTPEKLRELGIRREELLALSVKNLHARYPEAEVTRSDTYNLVSRAGDLESSWMLDVSFWNEESKRMEGELVASVPSREVMVWVDSANAPLLVETRRAAR